MRFTSLLANGPLDHSGRATPVGPRTPSPEEDDDSSGRPIGPAVIAVATAAAVVAVPLVSLRGDARWGVLGDAGLLAWVALRAARSAWEGAADGADGAGLLRSKEARWYTAIALVPLIRLLAQALPLAGRSEFVQHGLMLLPVFASSVMVIRACNFGRQDVGLWFNRSWRGITLDAIVAVAGFNVGYLAYRIWPVSPLADSLAPTPRLAAVLALLVAVAFVEELVFRGLIQRAGRDLLGTPLAIVIGAALSVSLQIGHQSPETVGLAFSTALIFGGVVAASGSLLGVTLSRATAYVCLLVVLPLR